jgi:lysophospholipase
MDQVPFYAVEAEGPDGGAAYWLKTEDGLRIRVGVWPEGGANGTVLLYPGRNTGARRLILKSAALRP